MGVGGAKGYVEEETGGTLCPILSGSGAEGEGADARSSSTVTIPCCFMAALPPVWKIN